MLNSDVRPSTLEGIKRLATRIRKEQRIKHSNALDLAAQAANCANYRHAQRTMPALGRSPTRNTLFLSVYWHDKDHHRNGRETLEIVLSKPIFDICSKSDLKQVRGFGALRLAAADHFVCDMLSQSQDYARTAICKAERSLRFMEHTGLRPSRDDRPAYPGGSRENKLPDADHPTYWVDPEGDQFILIDEPYNEPDAAARTTWAHRHGWRLRKSSWPGMYNPPHCALYVATDGNSSYDLDALMAKIDAIPAPVTEESWVGESAPSFDVFISPAAKTPQDRRRARSKGTITKEPSATTIPYGSIFGIARRRPAAIMPVAGHIEMGRIIKSVLYSPCTSNGVDMRMNTLRSTLEDWLTLEIDRDQLNGPEFFDVYYRDPDSEGPYAEAAQSPSGLIRILGELKQKLQSVYPDCSPLRKQLCRIDGSVSIIAKWKTTTG